MNDIPSFLVPTDIEKHIDFALTHRARWMKGASLAKRFQTELEVRRQFRIDATLPKLIDQVVWNRKASLVAATVTMAKMTIKLAHDVRDETLRV